MKKIILALATVLFSLSSAHAETGVNIGVSLSAGVFEADDATETFTGSHSSGAGSTVNKSTATDAESAEALVGFASIFVEKTLGPRFAIGIDYVPHSLETETAQNVQNQGGTSSQAAGALATNTVQIDFDDLTTLYASLSLSENIYIKAGFVQVDVVTNESLATGGAYGNTQLDGHTFAIGYDRDMSNDLFIRLEGSLMELDGATLVNTADAAKSVTASGISGYGAKLSIGKSF